MWHPPSNTREARRTRVREEAGLSRVRAGPPKPPAARLAGPHRRPLPALRARQRAPSPSPPPCSATCRCPANRRRPPHCRPSPPAPRACGDGTRHTYRSAWRAFSAWYASLDRPPLAGDPETVAMYAVHAANRGLSLSLRVALAAAKRRPSGSPVRQQHQRLAAPISVDQACRFTTWWKTVIASRALDAPTELVKRTASPSSIAVRSSPVSPGN